METAPLTENEVENNPRVYICFRKNDFVRGILVRCYGHVILIQNARKKRSEANGKRVKIISRSRGPKDRPGKSKSVKSSLGLAGQLSLGVRSPVIREIRNGTRVPPYLRGGKIRSARALHRCVQMFQQEQYKI